jgi:peptidoglycan hydrolase-like protein with peptidoglycan-binding domain
MAFNASVLGLTPIQKGSLGDAVAAWQRFLAATGYPVGVADGDFGKATDAATRNYQTKNGLPPTGQVNQATYQLALKQGLMFYVDGLTVATLLQALNFGVSEIKDLQTSLTKITPLRPGLVADGDFGGNSVRGLTEAYRMLDTKLATALNKALSSPTKQRLGADYEAAVTLLVEYARRLRLRLSGPQWVKQFPTSKSLEDLAFPFRNAAKNFAKALKDAGANVEITATYRPAARAFLMHYCVKVADEDIDASDVPDYPGIEIDWQHYTDAISVQSAQDMADAYDIAFPPVLNSRHTQGLAVDWIIDWKDTLTIKDANGKVYKLGSPRNGYDNQQLWAVGATYGVYKLSVDAPHWSSDSF